MLEGERRREEREESVCIGISNHRPVSPMLSPHLPLILIQSIKHCDHQLNMNIPQVLTLLITRTNNNTSLGGNLCLLYGETDMVWLVTSLQLDGQSEKSGERGGFQLK